MAWSGRSHKQGAPGYDSSEFKCLRQIDNRRRWCSCGVLLLLGVDVPMAIWRMVSQGGVVDGGARVLGEFCMGFLFFV